MGDLTDIILDSRIDEEYAFERYLYLQFHAPKTITKEELMKSWEDSIRKNEEYGVWQIGGKNPKKIFFSDLEFEHVVNIYNMLKENRMYIPAFIRNTAEKGAKNDVLNTTLFSEKLKGKKVLIFDKDITCNNCPLCYFNDYEPSEDFLGTGDNRHHCKVTNEDVNYQYKYKKCGVLCPLKDVR